MASGSKKEDTAVLMEDSDIELKCQPCEEIGDLHKSVGFCIDCYEFLCQRCFDTHSLPKPCRHHQTVTKEEMDILEKDLIQKCSVHEEKFVKFFCVLHEELCCMTCLSMNHHSCSELHYLPLHAQELSYLTDYQRYEQDFNICTETVLENPEHAKRKAETLDSSCSEALQQVKKFRQMLNKALDKDEAELIDEAEKMKSEGRKQLELLAEKHKGTQTEVQRAKEKLEALRNTKQNANLYIEMLTSRNKLQSLAYKVTQAKQEHLQVACKIQFSPNKEILDNLQRSESLGTLSTIATDNAE